jgi:hypothetical protein
MGWGELSEFDDALSGLKELRKLVEQRTLPHLLDEAIDAYVAGRPLASLAENASTVDSRRPKNLQRDKPLLQSHPLGSSSLTESHFAPSTALLSQPSQPSSRVA